MDRKILHCDMNSFYCSVELLEHPELREVPVAVAGDPAHRHGIILAKNEPAKRYGIVTAETIQSALKKCPDLHFLEPHHDKYSHYSKLINEIYLEYTDQVEPFSVDESWLDVTGSEGLFGPAKVIADEIRGRIRTKYGLTLSVGVSYNKTFAKMGSEYKKPDATTEITRDNYRELLWPMPAGDFFFIGKSTADKLESIGLRTVGDVARSDEAVLVRLLGTHGSSIHRAVNGLDDEPVRCWGDRDQAKSIGHGVTFARDISGESEVTRAVTEISDKVGARLRRSGMKAYGVKVEITTPLFVKKSRQHKSQQSITTAAVIKKEALSIIYEMGFMDSPIRLLTITAINLADAADAEQLTIFSVDGAFEYNNVADNMRSIGGHADQDIITDYSAVNESEDGLERTMDEIRERYGAGAIRYAGSLEDDM